MSGKASKGGKAAKNAQSLAPVVAGASATLPSGFKVARTITVPSLSIKKTGEGRALLFQSAFRESTVPGKEVKDPKTGEVTREKPATIANVIDVETGEAFIYLGASVVISNLERDYPDDGFVGKTFWIANKGKRKDGQRYVDYEIHEIEAAK